MLTNLDPSSLTWKVVADWAKQRRAGLLAQLVTPMLEERQADALRGAIAELDEMLKLAEPDKNVTAVSVNYGV